jgi:hypothetical protein
MSFNKKMALDIALLVAVQVGLFFAVKRLMTVLDPNYDRKEKAKAKSQTILNKLGVKEIDLDQGYGAIRA